MSPVLHPLNTEELKVALAGLPGWTLRADKLEKEFIFADFVAAFAWMSAVALEAERRGHHPEWFNVYRTVRVALQTHDAVPAGVTHLDVALALLMEHHASHADRA